MMPDFPQDRTYWNATAPAPDFPQLAGDISVDVAIIGAGIVGITTARSLKDLGRTVAVIEARKVGRQVTGRSTAKMTSQHKIIYQTLERKFGDDRARLYAEAQEAAIRQIQSFASRYGIAQARVDLSLGNICFVQTLGVLYVFRNLKAEGYNR